MLLSLFCSANDYVKAEVAISLMLDETERVNTAETTDPEFSRNFHDSNSMSYNLKPTQDSNYQLSYLVLQLCCPRSLCKS